MGWSRGSPAAGAPPRRRRTAPVDLLLSIYLFAFQIYCDFSGYTDIAIGVSLLFGVKLMENFRRPYLARSTAEFWGGGLLRADACITLSDSWIRVVLASFFSNQTGAFMFSNILCAVDGSEHALKAAEAASELAAKLGAKLTFLTVTKELKVTEEIKRYMEIENLTGSPQYVLDEMTEQVLQGAKDCARRCGLGSVSTEVKVGHPARTIVAFAKRDGTDLIVMGSRGHGDIEGVLLGSVSHKVSSLATCTCMTVK